MSFIKASHRMVARLLVSNRIQSGICGENQWGGCKGRQKNFLLAPLAISPKQSGICGKNQWGKHEEIKKYFARSAREFLRPKLKTLSSFNQMFAPSHRAHVLLCVVEIMEFNFNFSAQTSVLKYMWPELAEACGKFKHN